MLEDPAATGTGAGDEAQLARAMQRAAIPIIETPPERTWIWSDLHLADRSILLVWNRPFRSEKMNRHLLARWTERGGAGDSIICLGDVGHPDAWRDQRLIVARIRVQTPTADARHHGRNRERRRLRRHPSGIGGPCAITCVAAPLGSVAPGELCPLREGHCFAANPRLCQPARYAIAVLYWALPSARPPPREPRDAGGAARRNQRAWNPERMSRTAENFSRVKTDALLRDAGWNLMDGVSVLFKHALPDGSRTDYALRDRSGRPVAAIAAKRASVNPIAARDQGSLSAERLAVSFVFLSNGEEVWFQNRETNAHTPKIAAFYPPTTCTGGSPPAGTGRTCRASRSTGGSTTASARSHASRPCPAKCCTAGASCSLTWRRGSARPARPRHSSSASSTRASSPAPCSSRTASPSQGRPRTHSTTRALILYHALRPGRGFDRMKPITMATLQTMITEYRRPSSGSFDLVTRNDGHRSIYAKCSGVLPHFDAIQLGLTATPCAVAADMLPDPGDSHFQHHPQRFFELEEPTSRYPLRQAIDDGHLVPSRIYQAITVKAAAGDGLEVARERLHWTAMDPPTQSELKKLFASSDTITMDPWALKRTSTTPQRNRGILRESRDAQRQEDSGSSPRRLASARSRREATAAAAALHRNVR